MTLNLTNQEFGYWTAIKRRGSNARNSILWECKCRCGTIRTIPTSALRGNKTTSCGCKKLKHGHSSTRKRKCSITYASWQNMISRCTCPSYPSYEKYRARGITICQRWRSFENFLADMGERPNKKLTLDRWPNNDGNYEPGNCRWATRQQQANNRRTNVTVTFQGQKYTIAELARKTGVSTELLRSRLIRQTNKNQRKWSVEDAINTPSVRGKRYDIT